MPGSGHYRHGPSCALYRSIFYVTVGQVKSYGVRFRGDFADWLSNLRAGDRRIRNSYGRRSIVLLVIRWSFIAGSHQPLAFCDQRPSLVRRGTSGSGKCCAACGKGEVHLQEKYLSMRLEQVSAAFLHPALNPEEQRSGRPKNRLARLGLGQRAGDVWPDSRSS